MAPHALILAGGQSSRWQGKDKGLVEWQTLPLIEHVVQRLLPQVSGITISCNQNFEKYENIAKKFEAKFPEQKLPTIISDDILKNRGPLGGIASYFEKLASKKLPDTMNDVFICCCDTPLLPLDIVSRLQTMMRSQQSEACYPTDERHDYWLNLLVNVNAGRQSLQTLVEKSFSASQFSVKNWLDQLNVSKLVVDDSLAFSNINSPEILKSLNQSLDRAKKGS